MRNSSNVPGIAGQEEMINKAMRLQETSSEIGKDNAPGTDSDQSNDSVASKLSQELNNWRRRRTTAATRPRRSEMMNSVGGSSGSHTGSARTINVRGHETLVIRKPKMVVKPPANDPAER